MPITSPPATSAAAGEGQADHLGQLRPGPPLGSPPSAPSRRARSARAAEPGRAVGLAVTGSGGGELAQDHLLERLAMLGGAHHRPRPGRGQVVGDQQHPGRADYLHGGGAQPVTQAAHRRPIARAAPSSGSPETPRWPGDRPAAVTSTVAGNGSGRQRHERLGVGQLAHRRPARPDAIGGRVLDAARAAQPGVAGGGPEPVQADLGRLGVSRRQGPPPPAAWRNAPRPPPTPCGSPAAAGTAPSTAP